MLGYYAKACMQGLHTKLLWGGADHVGTLHAADILSALAVACQLLDLQVQTASKTLLPLLDFLLQPHESPGACSGDNVQVGESLVAAKC